MSAAASASVDDRDLVVVGKQVYISEHKKLEPAAVFITGGKIVRIGYVGVSERVCC